MKAFTILVLAVGFLANLPTAVADNGCQSVKGRVVSKVVTIFSDGSACTSPLGICSEGRFTGKLKGKFTFTADAALPYASIDGAAPGDMFATTGTLLLQPKRCHGALGFRDTSVFSFSPDGFFAGVNTADPLLGSGSCANATGRIRLEGVFQLGCVDCKYRGEICDLGDDD